MRVLILATLLGLAASLPTEPEAQAAAAAQEVHLVFHAAPAGYNLTIPADGQPHPTSCVLYNPSVKDIHKVPPHVTN